MIRMSREAGGFRGVKTWVVLQKFLNSRKAKGLSRETIRWYRGILGPFARKYRRLPKKPEPIEDFISECAAGDERKHGYYRALRCFYRFLRRRFKIDNPFEFIEAPKRKEKQPKALIPDELDQLLSYPHPPKIKAALLFLADTGARVGELAGLTPSDISETPWGYIAKITGKTGMRLVPLSPETYHALMQNLPFGYTTYRLRRLISQAFSDARVKGSAHTLRHTFGTLWEGDESALQNIMGHKHISTTQLYRHLRTKRLSIQHNKYSPLKMVFPRAKSML